MKKSNEFKIEIKKVDNGYICSWLEESDSEEDYYIKHIKIFENKETSEDELDVVLDLLYFIKEYFGVNYSKHNKRNLNIEIKTNDTQ